MMLLFIEIIQVVELVLGDDNVVVFHTLVIRSVSG